MIDDVDDRIFGGFIEHMGRCVYEGVFDPKSKHADARGFRTDVLDALRELQVSVVRYPGGNFASGYHWEDGVGDERPTVRELAWQSIEPNTFGTDEFLAMCQLMDWTPMLCVNLGTGTPEEARNWVEYCNSRSPTKYANMRRDNGHEDSYSVPLWCLGNEMDGPWQLGHVPAEQYAIRAIQAAKMMLDCDRTIETVVCGSSAPAMPTFPEWDRTVLEALGNLANYVSLHRYVGNREGDSANFLGISKSIDSQIEAIDACARYVQAKRRSGRRSFLCFDEWNVAYRGGGWRNDSNEPQFAPPIAQEQYNFEDALVVAMFLLSFIRHADSVKVANIAQLVNVLGPLQTRGDDLLRQTIYYAFGMISKRKGGKSLRQAVHCDSYDSAAYGRVPYLDSAVIVDGRRLKVFAVNRSLTEPLNVTLSLSGASFEQIASSEILHHESVSATNTYDNPETVTPKPFDRWSLGSSASAELPPLSLVATTFDLKLS